MDAMENPVLESRAERIARYKAERRRELAERYGSVDELPSKWVRRDGKETEEPATQARGVVFNSDGLGERVNGRTQEVTNGVEVEPDYLKRWVMSGVWWLEPVASQNIHRFLWKHLNAPNYKSQASSVTDGVLLLKSVAHGVVTT